MRLLFRREFHQAIRDGRKTQTVRLWVRQWVRVGQVCEVAGLGWVRIHQVEVIDLEDLTETDARADGFDCLADLRAKLGKIYGVTSGVGCRESGIGRQVSGVPNPESRLPIPVWYRVRFEYVGSETPSAPSLFEEGQEMTAQEIKQLRLDLGLTQQAFAQRVGISAATVHRWENGKQQPTTLALLRRLDNLARQVAKKTP